MNDFVWELAILNGPKQEDLLVGIQGMPKEIVQSVSFDQSSKALKLLSS